MEAVENITAITTQGTVAATVRFMEWVYWQCNDSLEQSAGLFLSLGLAGIFGIRSLKMANKIA